MTVTIFGSKRIQEMMRRLGGLSPVREDADSVSEIISRKVYSLLLTGEKNAGGARRDIIVPQDLPVTEPLREYRERYLLYDGAREMETVLAEMVSYPALGAAVSEETENLVHELAGALLMVSIELVKILEPGNVNPGKPAWRRVSDVMDLFI